MILMEYMNDYTGKKGGPMRIVFENSLINSISLLNPNPKENLTNLGESQRI